MKILVAYDGSLQSRNVLEVGISHAKAFGGQLIVATSLMVPDPLQELKVDQQLLEAQTLLRNRNIPFETKKLVRGLNPGEDLVKFSKDEEVDKIIIGIKNKSKVGKFIFGSCAQYVILESSCVVVTVKN